MIKAIQQVDQDAQPVAKNDLNVCLDPPTNYLFSFLIFSQALQVQ
jgi:hypothetical protein